MYQGTNPSALASQRRIAEAMLDLLTARPYEAISVAAICRAADVSRQTFYNLFGSRNNVLYYLLLMDTSDERPEFKDLDGMLRALSRNFIRFMVRKEPVLRRLAENNQLVVLRRLLFESIKGSDYLNGYVRPEMQPYVADYVSAGLTGMVATYLRCGTDPETLEDMTCLLIKGDLFCK